MTTVFVTHDQQEALELANEIVILEKGKIAHIGNSQEIFDHPANDFVKKFLEIPKTNKI